MNFRLSVALLGGAILLSASTPSIVYAERVIPPIIASATRSEEAEIKTPLSVTVVTRQEIEASGATHIAEVLRGRGVIQLTDVFGNGTRPTIGMRGFGESANANTLILVDGRRLNNTDIAAPDLNSVSLKYVERIEIINGSASVLYGDQAVGGVINIITRQPDKFSASVEVGVGSYNASQTQAYMARQFDNGFYMRLTGEQRQSDGYRDHNEMDYENIFALAGYKHGKGEVFVELQSTDESLNTPGALYVSEARIDRRQARPEFQNDFIDTKTDVVRAGIRQDINSNWSFEGELTYRESDGEFLQSFRYFPETIPATQRRRVVSINPRVIGRFPLNGDQLRVTLGYDYDDSRYRLSTRFGPQSNDQEVESWYAQAIVPLNTKLSFSAGARESHVENDLQDGGAFALYPNGISINDGVGAQEFGLNYQVNNAWRWYARLADNYRFAKVDEHLSPFGGQVLENQTGVSKEAGFEYQGKDWQWSASVYQLDLDNELAFDPNTFSNLNLEATQREGLSLSAQYQLNDQWLLSADASVVDAQVTSGVFAGNEVPLVADHSLRLGANYQINDRWRLYAELHAIGKRPYSGDFTNNLDALPGYGVVNARLTYEHKSWQVRAHANNLFDKRYAEFGARNDEFLPPTFAPVSFEAIQPTPERNFWISARYQFH